MYIDGIYCRKGVKYSSFSSRRSPRSFLVIHTSTKEKEEKKKKKVATVYRIGKAQVYRAEEKANFKYLHPESVFFFCLLQILLLFVVLVGSTPPVRCWIFFRRG